MDVFLRYIISFYFTIQYFVKVQVAPFISIDDTENTMESYLYIIATWRDPSLIWDPLQYSGIQKVELSIDHLWIPSVVAINEKYDHTNLLNGDERISLDYDGLLEIGVSIEGCL